MSSRERFTLTGEQYIELDKLLNGVIQPKLIKFKEFTLNIAHIVSIACTGRGTPLAKKEIETYLDKDGYERIKFVKV